MLTTNRSLKKDTKAIGNYLERIGIPSDTVLEPSLTTLKAVHQAHVFSVPFENLDIHRKTPIRLQLPLIHKKVVNRRRGGFCYELNALFHFLLRSLGFAATMIAARIYREEDVGPPYDHLAVLVQLQETWLADVGHGDLLIEPIRIDSTEVQTDRFKCFRVESQGNGAFILHESRDGQTFYSKYAFEQQGTQLSDYEDQCLLKQTASDSYFVENTICTRPHSRGRTTIFNDRLVRWVDGQRSEQSIVSNAHRTEILKSEFQIDLS